MKTIRLDNLRQQFGYRFFLLCVWFLQLSQSNWKSQFNHRRLRMWNANMRSSECDARERGRGFIKLFGSRNTWKPEKFSIFLLSFFWFWLFSGWNQVPLQLNQHKPIEWSLPNDIVESDWEKVASFIKYLFVFAIYLHHKATTQNNQPRREDKHFVTSSAPEETYWFQFYFENANKCEYHGTF